MFYLILLALKSILFSLFLVINLIFLDIETCEVYYTKIAETSQTISLPIIIFLLLMDTEILKLMLIHRADEWDVNKWAWEGALKVVSKEEECIIKLEDKTTGAVSYSCYLKRIDIILSIIGYLFY